MNNYFVIKQKLIPYLGSGLSQAKVAAIIGIRQESISYCCRKYDIKWERVYVEQRGEANPNFQGGLARSTIERLTRAVLANAKRDLFTCESCGFHNLNEELPRHHKDRNRANNSPDNLEILCQSCHMKSHNQDRKRDVEGRFVD